MLIVLYSLCLLAVLALNQLQFCDTAGHVKLHSFMPQYYRNARLILLVYCCHDEKTLRALSNWIDDAKKFLKDSRSTYSFCLVGLQSKQFLEQHPLLTYDQTKVTQESLSDFRSHYYLNENLMFEVNMDTKDGLAEMLVKLGQATKKLECDSQLVGEVASFALSDEYDITGINITPTSSTKKRSVPPKERLDEEKCC